MTSSSLGAWAAASGADGWTPALSAGQIIVRILFIFLLLGGFAYGLRRWSGMTGYRIAGRSSSMEVREALPLGPGRTLYLVRVEGRTLVLGATAQSIRLLAAWDEGGENIAADEGAEAASLRGFAAELRSRLGDKDRPGEPDPHGRRGGDWQG